MKVIHDFHDLEDGHNYQVGDEYPYDGRVVSEERIAALTSSQNKAGFALIKAEDTPKKAITAPVDEKPIETAEAPKKATRSRKKAT